MPPVRCSPRHWRRVRAARAATRRRRPRSSPAACAAFQSYAGHSGKTVTIFGSILSPESDSLNKSWAQFQSCTGIKIHYTGSNTFESDLPVKVNGGNAPDLALIPQPGLLKQMVEAGAAKKPPAQTVANEANWNSSWKDYGSVNGTFYAAPSSANMKTMVWYSPKYFAAHNYTVPTTWAQLMSLSAKIVSDNNGAKPWCGGLSSGTASGWPATDWLEEVVLGTFGGQVYDDWISHKIKFSDPQIQTAMKTVAGWMHNPAWVNGGYGDVKTLATTTFQNARPADPEEPVRDAAAGVVLRGAMAQGHHGQPDRRRVRLLPAAGEPADQDAGRGRRRVPHCLLLRRRNPGGAELPVQRRSGPTRGSRSHPAGSRPTRRSTRASTPTRSTSSRRSIWPTRTRRSGSTRPMPCRPPSAPARSGRP